MRALKIQVELDCVPKFDCLMNEEGRSLSLPKSVPSKEGQFDLGDAGARRWSSRSLINDAASPFLVLSASHYVTDATTLVNGQRAGQ